MIIKILTEDKHAEYELLSARFGSVFNSLNWLKIFGNDVTIYTITDKQDKIIGGFYTYTRNVAGVKFIKCPPFTPNNGLFIVGNVTNKANIVSDQKSLIKSMADFYEENKYGILRVSFPILFTDFQPFIWRKFKVVPNYTYVQDLRFTISEILSTFSPEKRNEIKKAEKDKIQLEQATDFNKLEELIHDSLKKNNIKYNKKILNRVLSEFSNLNNCFSYVAKNENGILAFSFCIHDNKTAYYLFGGNSVINKHSGAGSAALWECIKKAKALGLERFDFEGSMNPKIEHYFRGFGGELKPYYTVNKANVFLEFALSFIKREYF